MSKIDYQVSIIQQKENDKTCGPSCVAMLCNYFGRKVTRAKILKDLKISDSDTTYLFQLARYLRSSGLKVKGIVSHPAIVDPTWKGFTSNQLIDRLKWWIPNNMDHAWIESAIYYLFFLQEGGEITIKSVSKEIIEQKLNEGSLILTAINEAWVWGKRKIEGKGVYDDIKGKARGHYIIICGSEGKRYKVVDPYPTRIQNREREYWVDKDDLLASILMWSRELLVINK